MCDHRSGVGGTSGHISRGPPGHRAGHHRYPADGPTSSRCHLRQRLPGSVCAETVGGKTRHRLDVGGHAHNQHKVNEIIDTIRNEFPDLEISSIMLGIVSICHLGKPYEVHTLDITGQIIEHYKNGQVLPGGLEKARSIAMRGGYDFIEVYTDCCRAISANGTVSVISN